MCRSSGRGCTVSPRAPASNARRPKRQTSGTPVRREFRNRAILFKFTLSLAIPGTLAPTRERLNVTRPATPRREWISSKGTNNNQAAFLDTAGWIFGRRVRNPVPRLLDMSNNLGPRVNFIVPGAGRLTRCDRCAGPGWGQRRSVSQSVIVSKRRSPVWQSKRSRICSLESKIQAFGITCSIAKKTNLRSLSKTKSPPLRSRNENFSGGHKPEGR